MCYRFITASLSDVGQQLMSRSNGAREAHKVEGARLKAGFRNLSGWIWVQALENVTAAGIFVVKHANQPGSPTWRSDHFG